VFEALFAAGAVDVFTRQLDEEIPSILLTVICHPKQLLSCEAVLFRETSTLGIRRPSNNAPFCRVKFKELKLNMVWFASSLERKRGRPMCSQNMKIALS